MAFNDDEEIFDMDNINPDEKPKAAAPAVLPNPKSFVAVTSSERIRKISVVKNDFRPIVENHVARNNHPYDSKDSNKPEGESGQVHLPLSTSSSSSSAKRSSKDESTADEVKSGLGSKRKRKRRSIMKRKSTQRKISANAINSAEAADGSAGQDKTGETAAALEAEKLGLDDSVSVEPFLFCNAFMELWLHIENY